MRLEFVHRYLPPWLKVVRRSVESTRERRVRNALGRDRLTVLRADREVAGRRLRGRTEDPFLGKFLRTANTLGRLVYPMSMNTVCGSVISSSSFTD